MTGKLIAIRINNRQYNEANGKLEDGWFIWIQEKPSYNWRSLSRESEASEERALELAKILKNAIKENYHCSLPIYDPRGYSYPGEEC